MKHVDLAMVKAELNRRIELAASYLLPEGRRIHTNWVCKKGGQSPIFSDSKPYFYLSWMSPFIPISPICYFSSLLFPIQIF
jgi:hypothetical protein